MAEIVSYEDTIQCTPSSSSEAHGQGYSKRNEAPFKNMNCALPQNLAVQASIAGCQAKKSMGDRDKPESTEADVVFKYD